MPINLPVSMIVEITLGVLLIATVFVCARLEYRLKRLRSDQKELAGTIAALNTAIATAQKSMIDLRQVTRETGETLGLQLTAARTQADELSLLNAAGERIASRMEANRMDVNRALAVPQSRKVPMAGNDALRAVR